MRIDNRADFAARDRCDRINDTVENKFTPNLGPDIWRNAAIESASIQNGGNVGAAFVILEQCITCCHVLNCPGALENCAKLSDCSQHNTAASQGIARDLIAIQTVLKSNDCRIVAHEWRDRLKRRA